jgi:LDH2 family malate/lactate/ureidoglycolate dehydrogenase
MMALEHDMIGFCVSSSSPGVAPHGGVEPLLGNNPLAYAVPTGTEYPIVLDMACGVSAWGRVGTMAMYGRRLTIGLGA